LEQMRFFIFLGQIEREEKKSATLGSITFIPMGKTVEEKGVKPFRFFLLLTIRLLRKT
jgi:hypothetical protein